MGNKYLHCFCSFIELYPHTFSSDFVFTNFPSYSFQSQVIQWNYLPHIGNQYVIAYCVVFLSKQNELPVSLFRVLPNRRISFTTTFWYFPEIAVVLRLSAGKWDQHMIQNHLQIAPSRTDSEGLQWRHCYWLAKVSGDHGSFLPLSYVIDFCF